MQKLSNLNELLTIADKYSCQRLLFDFNLDKIVLKCLILVPNRVLMFSVKGNCIGCAVAINNYGEIDTYLPREFRDILNNDLKKQFNGSTNKMFEYFNNYLSKYLNNYDINKISESSIDEIKNIIKTIKTKEKEYDEDGENPFFKSWVRHKKNNFSPDNIKKTARYFGINIANLCENQNISTRWCDIFQKKSLDFLDIEKAKDEILNKK
jgi:hypothetical protein